MSLTLRLHTAPQLHSPVDRVLILIKLVLEDEVGLPQTVLLAEALPQAAVIQTTMHRISQVNPFVIKILFNTKT